MLIKQCIGYELEKEKSNTSEDFFNRSEVTFVEDGKEKTLHVLYVRYFDELAGSVTPFQQDPIFNAGSKEVYMRDLVALAALLKNPGYRHRKRVYINEQREFADIFKGLDYSKIPGIYEGIEQKGSFEVRSPLDYIIQPV
ncbi:MULTISPECIES: hypothetical protein [unclassified Bacillus (in: firmicutes)]|uniref:hypothetical protein n=1 Tax=unclassified Bacillus (in: firmicutes) TaxID=185979 RepID=UPI001BEAF04C|nr:MULTISPECIES: hypothetical protein [unclassified Bacillus (in: firmicutes)]MBT2638820.1 hypothetical protein [Bacillus sp. ISL-39]MBT2660963.1 hypothetical protein [Bacillus sp. ISL-45]